MKNFEQEDWIEEAMNSLDGISKASANPFMSTRVLARIDSGTGKSRIKHGLFNALVIGCVMILLLNVAGLLSFRKRDSVSRSDQASVAEVILQDYKLAPGQMNY